MCALVKMWQCQAEVTKEMTQQGRPCGSPTLYTNLFVLTYPNERMLEEQTAGTENFREKDPCRQNNAYKTKCKLFSEGSLLVPCKF
jgi:hypothetical protein